jgi:transposase
LAGCAEKPLHRYLAEYDFRYNHRVALGFNDGERAALAVAALILPACNTEAMNLHLAEIAEMVAPGAHAVLLVDQAGWHLSARLVIPANITILPLPPKSPELNPVENVWQFMRDNWLSNRVFKSYDDLVDHCCEAWNKLVDQPWRIMSIGLRNWANGF